ncbi:hypothetical protein ACFLR0_00665 [Candidatus Bipolaricaulota bacterium]
MSRPTLLEPIALFRLRRSVFFALLSVVLLLSFGRVLAALGVVIGVLLFAANLFLLYEAGRSLLSASSSVAGRALAAGSSLARFLMMGVALWLVFAFLGRDALLGACGGLFLSQVSLHFPLRRVEGVV